MIMFNAVLLLGVLTGLFLAVGLFLGGVAGMTVALLMAVVINFISYWYSDRIVLKLYRAEPSKSVRLGSIVGKLAQEAKIPRPGVYIVPQQAPNAFATGRGPGHASIAVTKGLLDFPDDEIEGVLAHEMSHIRNRDVLVSTLAATIAGAIAYLAQIGYFALLGGDDNNRGNLVGIVLIVVFAPLAALLIRLAISRGREYGADRTGAAISKNPKGLADALERISRYGETNRVRGSSATSHMWIASPPRRDWFTALLSTHPPMNERIRRLREMHIT
jgi:heat shock protein HtpX